MEYKKLCESKLKVILTQDECQSHGINPYKEKWAKENITPFIGEILEYAKLKMKFNKSDDRVFLQIFPCEDGGAELFVTIFSSIGEREMRVISGISTIPIYKRTSIIYRFSKFRDLIFAMHHLYGINKKCDVYYADNGDYYINFVDCTHDGMSIFDIFSEYGERVRDFPAFILAERAKMIIKGKGIEILSKI